LYGLVAVAAPAPPGVPVPCACIATSQAVSEPPLVHPISAVVVVKFETLTADTSGQAGIALTTNLPTWKS